MSFQHLVYRPMAMQLYERSHGYDKELLGKRSFTVDSVLAFYYVFLLCLHCFILPIKKHVFIFSYVLTAFLSSSAERLSRIQAAHR